MSITDYLFNIALVGLVLVQVRGRKLTVRNLVLPVAIVVWVATQYLRGIPTSGNDLILETGGAAIGATLGILAGMATRVREQSGNVYAKAGLSAAVLWVLGIGSRVAFSLYAQHGGQPSIARFSAAHHITSGEAWVACFVLMALIEVLSRTGVLFLKARRSGGVIERGRRFSASAVA